MKKLEDAMRRFGTPDHGRTAKRLRDFEAQLVSMPADSTPRELAEVRDELLRTRHGEPIAITGSYGRPFPIMLPGSEAHDKVIARQYSVIQSLQVLLNQKDEEIDILRSAPPVRARDLWIAAGLVSLVLLSAYYGFM